MSTKPTKYALVMNFIAKAGPEGRSYGEIQRYIVEELNGHDYDEMEDLFHYPNGVRTVRERKRRWRGFWADHLVGNYREMGMLKGYCKKMSNGKWRLR